MKQSYYNVISKTLDGVDLLFNTFTQALVEIEPDEMDNVKQILENPDHEYTDEKMKDYKQFLVDNHYLIDDYVDELSVIKTRNYIRRFNKEGFQLVVLPTMDCNFACPYCYEDRQQGFLSESAQQGIKNWIDKIVKNTKYLGIGWFGGEPLMGFEIIERINRYAIEKCEEEGVNFHSNITTNGYLFNDEIISKLDELEVNNVQITLDGPPEHHNQTRPLRNGNPTFDIIFENIKNILDNTDTEVQIRVNIDKQNQELVPQLLDLIPAEYRKKKLKIYFRNIFGSCFDDERGYDKERRLYTYKAIRDLYNYALKLGYKATFPILSTKDHYCESCLMNHFVVRPDAKIVRCTVGMEDSKIVGEITEDAEVNINFGKIAEWMAMGPADAEKCAKCKFLPMCMGGCRNERLNGFFPCPYESQDIGALAEQIYMDKTLPMAE